MQQLTPEGHRIVDGLAQTHGVSPEAVLVLLRAVAAGGGAQAQFNHPDLGGMGQWSQGGMIMIGDMFNQGLKYKVSALCDALSGLLRGPPLFEPEQTRNSGGASLFVSGTGASQGWPAELGVASSTGAQNDLAYAFFPATRRLAIRQGGQVRVYDTNDHQIGGFSQQQSGDQSLTFTSQFGIVRVADLPVVTPAVESAPVENASISEPEPATTVAPKNPASHDEIFAALERLADLRQKNVVTEEEFAAKKAELLSRL